MSDLVPFTDVAAATSEVRAAVGEGWAALLDAGRFIGGEACERFEQSWAEYCGARYVVGVGNGTDALQLTLTALGIGAGDEVVVPANTFVAFVEAIVLPGATPRFVDVSPDTLLLTPEALEAAINQRTRAVIVVHLYGQMPDMDALCRTAERAGIALVEDAAQAHGATWRGRRAGSFGLAGCFSFYPAKNLGAFGDAGAVVTSDRLRAERVRCLNDHGRVGGSHYRHAMVGTNSRLDALQAFVLTAKLAKLDAWTLARRAIARRYREALESRRTRLVTELPGSCGVYHLAVFGCRTGNGSAENFIRAVCRRESTTRNRAIARALPALRDRPAAGCRAGGQRGAVIADVSAHDRRAASPRAGDARRGPCRRGAVVV